MSRSYDLVVVGTGFASTFFLKKYLEKASTNVRVLILERGRFYSHSDRLKDTTKGGDSLDPPWLKADRLIVNENRNKDWIFEPNFGGGSNCWTGCTPRFLPSDFQLQKLYGQGVDWPIGYDDLAAYYDEVESLMAISGPEKTPFPRSKVYPLPPHALSSVDLILAGKYESLYISQPSARASVATPSRNACCTSSVCQLCPVDAKFTIENGFPDIYNDPRIEVEYNAQVFALKTSGDRAQQVVFRKEDKDVEVAAEVMVLGCNAIFNAHILLNSGDDNPHTGTGLSEQVGKYAWIYFTDLDNLGGGSVISANGYMMYDGPHRRDRAACLIENHNLPFIRNEAGKWRKLAKFKFVYEDLPNAGNRVERSDDLLKPVVTYGGYSEYVQRSLDRLPEDIQNFFSVLPIEKVAIDDYVQRSEAHILGTTRMGTSIENSVIDTHMLHHKYRNVFVLGGGAFPTITASNPTLTLSALSLMAADKQF